MTRSRTKRLRPAGLTAGATLTALSASAVALAAAPVGATPQTRLSVGARHVMLGHRLPVSGATSPSLAGQRIAIQFEAARSRSWTSVGSALVDPSGHFHTTVLMPESGLIRASGVMPATTRSAHPAAAPDAAPSGPVPVSVGSVLQVRPSTYSVLVGQPVLLRGRLLPAAVGRRVALQVLRAGRWQLAGTARTGPRGGFTLRYTPQQTGGRGIRVAFAGDRMTTTASHGAGAVRAFRETTASWYDDGGQTACGYHAASGYGVANLSLPCGTQVTFRHGGRTVTATVDDRGPYVSGREYDLNQNVAAALGFDGVGTVWTTQ